VTDLLQRDTNLVILAMDQMSLYFQATLTHVWAPKGHTPMVRITPQRDHIHWYGALDVRQGREITIPALEQTHEVTADFMRILLMLFPTQPILLLLDRAPWHFDPAIRTVLAENPRLLLEYFPTACPDLTPHEHIWSDARHNVSHNHTHTQFSRLIDAFDTYLNETPFETNFMTKYTPAILGEF
jgi:transposase